MALNGSSVNRVGCGEAKLPVQCSARLLEEAMQFGAATQVSHAVVSLTQTISNEQEQSEIVLHSALPLSWTKVTKQNMGTFKIQIYQVTHNRSSHFDELN